MPPEKLSREQIIKNLKEAQARARTAAEKRKERQEAMKLAIEAANREADDDYTRGYAAGSRYAAGSMEEIGNIGEDWPVSEAFRIGLADGMADAGLDK